MDVQPYAVRLQGAAQPVLPSARVAADVGRHVHLVGARLGGDPAHLADEVAVAHDQPSAPLAQTGVEVAQAVGEEGQPVGYGEPCAVHRGVTHEQRDDPAAAVQACPQRRMVVQTQVGGEQDDRDVHGAHSGEQEEPAGDPPGSGAEGLLGEPGRYPW